MTSLGTHDDSEERSAAVVDLVRQAILAGRYEPGDRLVEADLSAAFGASRGVVRSVTTIVRTVVPAALVRPEDLIEAAFALADQGLRVSRQLALTLSSSVRSLTTAA